MFSAVSVIRPGYTRLVTCTLQSKPEVAERGGRCRASAVISWRQSVWPKGALAEPAEHRPGGPGRWAPDAGLTLSRM